MGWSQDPGPPSDGEFPRHFSTTDLICTMELLAEKAETNSFTHSELDFFDNIRDFKKNYLKHIRKKAL